MSAPHLNTRESQLRLQGTLGILHWPRYAPTQREELLCCGWCSALLVAGELFGVTANALRGILLWPALPLLLDLALWWERYSSGRWYLPQLKFLSCPFTSAWGLVIFGPAVAGLFGQAAWYVYGLTVLAGQQLELWRCVREHYIDYCLEHPALTVDVRDAWRQSRQVNWSPIPPTTPHSSPLDQATLAWRNWARRGLRSPGLCGWLVWGGVLLFAGWAWELGAADFLQTLSPAQALGLKVGITGLMAPAALSVYWRQRHLNLWLQATWHALQVWCQSPPSVPPGSRAPWSARSQFGDAENRRWYLVWHIGLLSLVLLEMTVLHPLCAGQSSSFTVVGSLVFTKFLDDQQGPLVQALPLWVDIAWSVIAVPLCVCLCALALVGPAAAATGVLFESDSATEHDRTGRAALHL